MAEVTLIEKVTKALLDPWWDSFDPERAAKNAIKVILKDLWKIAAHRDNQFGAAMASEIFCYARDNGIDLNG